MEWTKTHSTVVMVTMRLESANLNNTCWRDFASLPCHIVLKELIIIYYWISLEFVIALIRNIILLIFSLITITVVNILGKNRHQHNTSYRLHEKISAICLAERSTIFGVLVPLFSIFVLFD